MKALLAGPARPRRRATTTASDAGDGEALTVPGPPAFAPRLVGWAGIPAAADALAVADDGTLAVSCPDGRLLVAGPPDGREVALDGPNPGGAAAAAPTVALAFLPRSAGLVRGRAGGVDAWALRGGVAPPRRASLAMPDDGRLTALAVLPADTADNAGDGATPTMSSLLAVGRSDGGVAIARCCSAGQPSTFACFSLTWTGYELSAAADFGGAAGPVSALAVGQWGSSSSSTATVLLVGHAVCGATAWDLRRQAPVTAVEAPGVTSLAWLKGGKGVFATGQADGRVRGWGVPLSGGASGGDGGPPAATPLWALASPAGPGPVRGLLPLHWDVPALTVWGTAKPADGEDSPPSPPPAATKEVILLTGPGLLDRGPTGPDAPPAMLSAQAAPWFGPVARVALAPSPPPPAILVLSEGGQVLAHDPAMALAPAPVGLPAQALPEVCAAVVVGGVDLAPVLAASAARGVTPTAAGWRVPLPAWRRPVTAKGAPPKPPPPTPSALIFTGHVDGRLRVWAGCEGGEPPALLDASPWGAGFSHHAAARPVTALAACPAAGLAGTGHVRGLATLHQWSGTARTLSVASLAYGGAGAAAAAPPAEPLLQPPGWQVVATVEVAGSASASHPPSISALALDGGSVVALGDESGGVAVLDVARPAVAWHTPAVAPGGVSTLAFICLCGGARALLVGGANGSVALLDAVTGKALPVSGGGSAGGAGSAVVAAIPLGADGAPFHAPLPASPAILPWATAGMPAADMGHLGAAPAQQPAAVEVATGPTAPAETPAEVVEPPPPLLSPPQPGPTPPSPVASVASTSPSSSSDSDLLAAAVAAAEAETKARKRRPQRGNADPAPAEPPPPLPPPAPAAPPPPSGRGVASAVVATDDGRVQRVGLLPGVEGEVAADLPSPTRAAWPFTASGGAPALALLGGDGALRAVTLPSLTQLPPTAGVRLDRSLGLAGGSGGGPVLAAASLAGDGGMLLVGPAGEWVRVAVGDPEVATPGVREDERSAVPEPVAQAPAPPPPVAVEADVVEAARPPPPPLLSAILGHARDAAGALLATTGVGGGGGSAGPPPPSLEAVLGGPRLVQLPPSQRRRHPPPPPLAAGGSAGGDDAAARAALFAGAHRPARPGGVPAPRSAAEVRAKYGRPLPGDKARPAGGVAGAVGAVLSEAAAALARRGDQLQDLQAKTSGLVDDAASFEEVARAVRAREERRKWWRPF